MDTSSKDSEPLETEESAVNNAENTSFILGNGECVTPHKHAAEVTPLRCTSDTFKSPLNFSTVTVEQLGITPESFVKNSSGESSSYLKKSRRRSTVGVRGSPETNHLIRFIAQQRNLKNASLTKNSPFQVLHTVLHEAVECNAGLLRLSADPWESLSPIQEDHKGSPVLYRNVHSLREQMSAFQLAFHSIKENEKMTGCPEFSENERKFETTGSTKKESLGECQQSEIPAKLSSKRRRIASPSNSDGNVTDAAHLQILSPAAFPSADRMCAIKASADPSEKSSESGCVVEESAPRSELTEASSGMQVAGCAESKGPSDAISGDKSTEMSTDPAPGARPLAAPLCPRDSPSSATFVLRSVLKKPSAKLRLESLQEHHDSLCDSRTQPSLISALVNCCKERKAEGKENSKAPAFLNVRKRKRVTFGEDLSPEVFDESLPANTPLRKGETPVRKKDLSSLSPLPVEQSPVPERLSQPDFDDKGENLENIEPLQVSFAVLSPLSKPSVSEALAGTDTFASSNNLKKITSRKVGRETRTSNRSGQLISFSEETVCNLLNTEAQPQKEKKVNRRKSQESKRTDRAPPKKKQVLKSCRKKKAKGKKKSVQKSLYGERDIASKKPLLSPIPELPEVSEVAPSVPSVWRMCSDDFISNGELEDVKLPKEKNLLPQNPDVQLIPGCNKYDVSGFGSPYMRSSSSLTNAAFEQDSNIHTTEIHGNRSGNPSPDFALQSQEASAAGQNVENLFEIFKISEDVNVRCENQDGFLVIPEGRLPAKHFMPGSQKARGCSEAVSTDGVEGSKAPGEDLGRNSREGSSGVSSRERKYRRPSMCCSDGQSVHLENQPSYGVSGSVEKSLEDSDLYKDLSDAIEQAFQRTESETKVRRSTRLQKGLESEGLVWVSLPCPPTSWPSQKTKRRTVGTLGSRGPESEPSRQNPCGLPFASGEDHREGFAAAAAAPSLPRGRRKSFCTSALADVRDTTRSKGRRRTFLSQKGEEALQVTSTEPDITEN